MASEADAQVAFPLDTEFSGATAPQGTAPWTTATFVNNGSNTVRLTMSAFNLVASEFVSVWLFNFDPALNPADLYFSAVDITDVSTFDIAKDITTGTDFRQVGGGGKFDIEIQFPNSNAGGGLRRFKNSDEVILDITYGSAITASSFNFLSAQSGGQSSFHSAAHVQGIGPRRADSGWIGNTTVVPEPVSSILFISGGATLGFMRFRRKFKK